MVDGEGVDKGECRRGCVCVGPMPPPLNPINSLFSQALVEFVLQGARELVDEARAKALVEEVRLACFCGSRRWDVCG